LESAIQLWIAGDPVDHWHEILREKGVASDVHTVASCKQHVIDMPIGAVAQSESYLPAIRRSRRDRASGGKTDRFAPWM
jgi:hypothetical protein